MKSMNLNLEQTKLIEAKPNGISLIKGIAGSGKTTIALHRALFLHRHYCSNPADRVLLATFNRTLINYLQCIYEEIEKEYGEYYANIFSDTEEKVDILTIDQIIYQYYNENVAEPDLKPLYNHKIAMQILMESFRSLPAAYRDISILRDANFIMDEITWIKSCNYLHVEEYQKVDRLGRTKIVSDETPQRLPKDSKVRQGIFEIMVDFDYRMKESGYLHPREMAVKALEHARQNKPMTYKHIIIDEGQDLSRVQIDFLKTIHDDSQGSSFTFITDVAQSIYSSAWLVKGRSFMSVGLDVQGRSNSLAKNYRTSTQVAQAAYSLIENDPFITENENFVPPALLDQQGQYPIIKSFSTDREEAEYVANEVKSLLKQGYKSKDIAIIARMKKQLGCVKECFEESGLPGVMITTYLKSFSEDSIRFLTMHAIKGLEFKVVFIVGLNKDVIPYEPSLYKNQDYAEVNERKLLYVGMTRAAKQLYLSYWGPPSKFIKDLNPEFLRLNSYSKIRPFYKVSVDRYHCPEKVRHTYSAEEEVRQWVVKELVNTYKYPSKLIEIEVKTQLFSQPGSIDIVVNTCQANSYAPFIIFETKTGEVDINSGMEQLKSYMAASPTVKYGALTNGSNFFVIDSNHKIIEDIPEFHQSMISAGGLTYRYINLDSKQQYIFITDCDCADCITVEDVDQKGNYTDYETVKVPVFNKVAAGDPHLMEDSTGESFYLPSAWYKDKNNIFIIRVKGDSMVEADIDDGDLVVVEKQHKAENRDIVIVALEDESVIKRYTIMGSSVLLVSENDKYEPIQIRSEQAIVLGKVIGVIKNSSS